MLTGHPVGASARPAQTTQYGEQFTVTDGTGNALPDPCYTAHLPLRTLYDEQFTLVDANGAPLKDAYYTACMPSGELRNGITDSLGRADRYQTDTT